MNDGPKWFAPKRFGIGAGGPIAWQGWAVLAAFAALVGLAVLMFGQDDMRSLAIVLPATALLLIVAARTTRGGWCWRWGKDD